MAPLVVLGATGSIGRQGLEVAGRLGMAVVGLAVRSPGREVVELASRHPEATMAVAGGSNHERRELEEKLGDRVAFGPEAIVELAKCRGCVVLNGIVGAAGLPASVAALEAGNRLALANKESLVAGGPVVVEAARRGGGEIVPVDSEHSAVFQCLAGERTGEVRRLILTASGGPFRGFDLERLAEVTADQALRHPNWSMGRRITIDSATLFNKGLEVIEAHYLFGIAYSQIEVVVHPQSVVHSLVEFVDGSVKAQLGFPDMRPPIQYALTYPERRPAPTEPYPFPGTTLTFEAVDRDAFPALDLAFRAGAEGGSSPAVLNAADEVAVAAFLEGRLGLVGIARVVEQALDLVPWRELANIDEVLAVDREARAVAGGLVAGAC